MAGSKYRVSATDAARNAALTAAMTKQLDQLKGLSASDMIRAALKSGQPLAPPPIQPGAWSAAPGVPLLEAPSPVASPVQEAPAPSPVISPPLVIAPPPVETPVPEAVLSPPAGQGPEGIETLPVAPPPAAPPPVAPPPAAPPPVAQPPAAPPPVAQPPQAGLVTLPSLLPPLQHGPQFNPAPIRLPLFNQPLIQPFIQPTQPLLQAPPTIAQAKSRLSSDGARARNVISNMLGTAFPPRR